MKAQYKHRYRISQK